jgi:hypothetical protein
VHAGDNYGFPKCNRTVAANCHGFTPPFRTFAPHTDLMGIALQGGTFYLTSFQGPGAKGPGGEVYSLRLGGSTLKPLLTGFVAPVVGLGLHHGYVYVGELTGQVFRVSLHSGNELGKARVHRMPARSVRTGRSGRRCRADRCRGQGPRRTARPRRRPCAGRGRLPR